MRTCPLYLSIRPEVLSYGAWHCSEEWKTCHKNWGAKTTQTLNRAENYLQMTLRWEKQCNDQARKHTLHHDLNARLEHPRPTWFIGRWNTTILPIFILLSWTKSTLGHVTQKCTMPALTPLLFHHFTFAVVNVSGSVVACYNFFLIIAQHWNIWTPRLKRKSVIERCQCICVCVGTYTWICNTFSTLHSILADWAILPLFCLFLTLYVCSITANIWKSDTHFVNGFCVPAKKDIKTTRISSQSEQWNIKIVPTIEECAGALLLRCLHCDSSTCTPTAFNLLQSCELRQDGGSCGETCAARSHTLSC